MDVIKWINPGKIIYIQKGHKSCKTQFTFPGFVPFLLSGLVVVLAGEVLHDLVHLAGHLGFSQHLGGEALRVGQGRRLLMMLTKGCDEPGGHLPGTLKRYWLPYNGKQLHFHI